MPVSQARNGFNTYILSTPPRAPVGRIFRIQGHLISGIPLEDAVSVAGSFASSGAVSGSRLIAIPARMSTQATNGLAMLKKQKGA
jgi:hypothetical protein